jgi:hypothetical protein
MIDVRNLNAIANRGKPNLIITSTQVDGMSVGPMNQPAATTPSLLVKVGHDLYTLAPDDAAAKANGLRLVFAQPPWYSVRGLAAAMERRREALEQKSRTGTGLLSRYRTQSAPEMRRQVSPKASIEQPQAAKRPRRTRSLQIMWHPLTIQSSGPRAATGTRAVSLMYEREPQFLLNPLYRGGEGEKLYPSTSHSSASVQVAPLDSTKRSPDVLTRPHVLSPTSAPYLTTGDLSKQTAKDTIASQLIKGDGAWHNSRLMPQSSSLHRATRGSHTADPRCRQPETSLVTTLMTSPNQTLCRCHPTDGSTKVASACSHCYQQSALMTLRVQA